MTMFEVEGLDAWYGRHQVLRDVSVRVDEGEYVAIIGPNGAGKSSLMHAILSVGIRQRGAITYQGQRIDHLATHQIVRQGISLIPTGRQLFPYMTVYENLQLGGFTREDESVAEAIDRIFSYFPVLRDRRKQRAGTLSGGEQQMLALGRGLMSNPKFFLIDEPSMGLAPKIIASIVDIIGKLNETGISILLVEQNANLALKNASRVYVLENGRIAASGTSEEMSESTRIRDLYLGV